ncbi:MAG: aminopeptidase N, partial [Alphaproteobacteria bacterium]|nr:aminopeptidase N [Alphaproteobacteria bacterium]
HSITWVDPFPKPSYLFATIAGDMEVVTGTYTTMSGKDVSLRIVVPKGYEDKVDWAMQSIKNAMKWDEEKYGLEYDLDCLHLIGLEKFNMGAMENKGAIVFNIKDLCGSPESSSDAQLLRIETVIGHEYFHNYTGDRVTVRDWFEISLKESLTERRNEQFSGDMNSKAIQTIDDAVYIRNVQFREDGGPTAHCVRPERAESFENIYSPTVYNKGAQLLRMMETIMGSEDWYKGVKHYLDKFDGEARIVDDFVAALEEYSGRDLKQFFRWYTQAGTPEISYEGKYDAKAKTYTLTLKQHQPATPGQPAASKKPLHIPVRLGLISQSGKDVPLTLKGEKKAGSAERVLDFTKAEQTFVFKDVAGPVVPSLFRDFSAPVKVVTPVADDELVFRMSHDSDPFNRFDAGQQMMAKTMRQLLRDHEAGMPLALPKEFTAAYGLNLADAADGDRAFAARMLGLPDFTQDLKQYDPEAAKTVTDFVRKTLAETFEAEFKDIYAKTATPAGETFSIHDAGRRDLHNAALRFLGTLETQDVKTAAQAQYDTAANMTERQGALGALARMGGTEAEKALDGFHAKYREDTNVMDTWLSLSAQTAKTDAAGRVKELMKSDVFDLTNPNKVRALLGGFTANTEAFHAKDGSGYKLLADIVISLNTVNPHTATGIIRPLAQFQRYDDARQALIVKELKRIMATPQLDTQIKDIVGKAIESAAPSLKAKTSNFGKKPKQ